MSCVEIKHLFDLEKYYGETSVEQRELVELINNGEYTSLDDLAQKSQGIISPAFGMTKRTALITQVITLILSLILFWILVTALLFNFHLPVRIVNFIN